MTSFKIGGLAVAAGLFFSLHVLAEDRVQIKGYYKEDGSYVKSRVIEPLPLPSAGLPDLPPKADDRRARIENYFEGRTVKAKMSFPACRAGVVVRTDDPSRTNVDLFKKAGRYGVAIDKGETALITGFKVKDRVLDVSLSGGGYGTPWDVAKRVVLDICTAGLNELRNYQNLRYRGGSRLRIVSPKPFTKDDLTFEKVLASLAPALES